MSRIGSSASLAAFGRGTGLELGQATTFSFIGVVIALYLVRKSSELSRLHIRIELDVDRALPLSVMPGFPRRAFLHARWWAEQGAHFALALADQVDGRARRRGRAFRRRRCRDGRFGGGRLGGRSRGSRRRDRRLRRGERIGGHPPTQIALCIASDPGGSQ